MPGVGLQLLPMTALESSLTLGSCPFPQPCSATLPAANSSLRVLCLGGVCPACSGQSELSGCLGVWLCGSVQPCASPGTVSAWADARTTSVEYAHVGMLQMPVSYGLAGLGWGPGAFLRKPSSRHQDGDGQVLTKNGPRTVTAPCGLLYLRLQQTATGYKYLLGSCCTSSHCNRNHNHSTE